MSRAWLLAVLIGCLSLCEPHLTVKAAEFVGQPARSMVVTTLDGRTIDLSTMLGKVVLVNYWATWCAPCREELPTLNAFFRRYHDRGLEMIGISVDRPRDRARVLKASRALAYPAAMFNELAVNGFGEPEGVPLTWVIDANGIVRDKFIAVDNELLAKVVLPLLPAPALPPTQGDKK
jgi:cytochrome c biogenesis protein CcmG, thiol:disulfide interchange protein DsbE